MAIWLLRPLSSVIAAGEHTGIGTDETELGPRENPTLQRFNLEMGGVLFFQDSELRIARMGPT